MNILKRFNCHAVLLSGALLLCASLAVQAVDIESDHVANKQKDAQADAQARFHKGLVLTEQGKTADAIKIFSALTDDYPDLPEPYNNLAVLYAAQGQYDKAKLLLEKAISTHPSYATAHENLGDIYAKMASQAYDRALQLDHGNTATQTKLAMIQNLFAGGTRNKEIPARNTPVLGKVEGPVLSKVEGPVLSKVEGPVLGKVEGPAPSNVEEAAPVIAGGSQPGPAQTAPAASASVSAPKTESAASPPKHAVKKESSKEALKTVTAWAAAWSAKKADKYLSFYADDFKTPGGETRAAWEAARRERISKPKHIHIGIRNMTIRFIDSDHATVKFRQSYRASHLKTSSNKTLLMVKSGDKWLIQEERS
jgi:tetratricopeptide (TPR) repeat protein